VCRAKWKKYCSVLYLNNKQKRFSKTDKYQKNYAFSLMIIFDVSKLTICVEWAKDGVSVGLTLTMLGAKNDFYVFVPSDLDLSPFDL